MCSLKKKNAVKKETYPKKNQRNYFNNPYFSKNVKKIYEKVKKNLKIDYQAIFLKEQKISS